MDFLIGCNYWASHAGADMWRDWNAEQVEKDLVMLKARGMNTLRVFINWRDFQPVEALYGHNNVVREYVLSGGRKPENEYYLDEEVMGRFDLFCDLAEKYGLNLIVGLVTGWMSGRMYVPAVLGGRNTFTDPVSLRFQIKLVSGVVSRFKGKKAIYAWNLGNECNNMSPCNCREEAYNWSALIANTIRANDPQRPVISGMHGLKAEKGNWLIGDQAEVTDMLTTHPYAYFVEHCSQDPMNSIRTLMHGTCETLLYRDIGRKPCLVEELGTLSNSLCSDEVSAQFMKLNLLSNWAHGAPGVLWWCAFEQSHLTEAPYDWCMLERELGMFDRNQAPKKYLLAMEDFSKWLEDKPNMSDRPQSDTAILLSHGNDQWGVTYMSFILAKQAGLEPEFVAPDGQIPDKPAYILASAKGDGCLSKRSYEQLKAKVMNGAVLYVSSSDAFFTEMEEFFGVRVKYTEASSPLKGEFSLKGKNIPYAYGRKRVLESAGAQVLAMDSAGDPILTVNSYGKGKVYFLGFPMEEQLLRESYGFDSERYGLYEGVFEELLMAKPVRACHPKAVCVLNGETVTVMNFSDETIDPQIILKGVSVNEVLRGSLGDIEPCEACVFTIKKT